jgi:DNA-binding NtrC family response regulator
MSSYSHAGVSKLDGKFKVRFANDALRTKVLIKNGHTDIDIVELKHPMSKEEAVAFLLSIDFDNGNKEVRAALEAEQGKREPKATKVAAPKAVKKVAKTKPTMEAIKAKVAKVAKAPKVDTSEMEDAPF